MVHRLIILDTYDSIISDVCFSQNLPGNAMLCLFRILTFASRYGGTPASSTTKTGRHKIAEILLKVALNTKNQSKSIKL
jgi:hypothetical protein